MEMRKGIFHLFSAAFRKRGKNRQQILFLFILIGVPVRGKHNLLVTLLRHILDIPLRNIPVYAYGHAGGFSVFPKYGAELKIINHLYPIRRDQFNDPARFLSAPDHFFVDTDIILFRFPGDNSPFDHFIRHARLHLFHVKRLCRPLIDLNLLLFRIVRKHQASAFLRGNLECLHAVI